MCWCIKGIAVAVLVVLCASLLQYVRPLWWSDKLVEECESLTMPSYWASKYEPRPFLIDQVRMETAQRNMLKSLYRSILPVQRVSDVDYVKPRIDFRFSELPESSPTMANVRQIRQLLPHPGHTKVGPVAIVMVQVSGSGKTASLLQLARREYVIFLDFTDQEDSIKPDVNLEVLRDDVKSAARELLNAGKFPDPYADTFRAAVARLRLDLCARLIYLFLMMQHNPSIRPVDFIDSQLNGGQDVVSHIVDDLKRLVQDPKHIQLLAHNTLAAVRLRANGSLVLVAVDEAGAARSFMNKDIVSQDALSNVDESLFYDPRHVPLNKYRRGLLYPLMSAAISLDLSVVAAGTDISLAQTSYYHSTFLSSRSAPIVMNSELRLLSKEEVVEDLDRYFNVTSGDLPSQKLNFLRRPRLLETLKMFLVSDITSDSSGSPIDPMALLSAAVDRTIASSRPWLEDLMSELPPDVLGAVAAASTFRALPEIRLPDDAKFVRLGLCYLRNVKDRVFDLPEPLVQSVLVDVVKTLQFQARGVRILTLDGGGTRGIAHAVFLEELEKATNKSVSEMFDLVAGTSAGGLVALGIAAGLRPADMLRLFRDLAEEVFSTNVVDAVSRKLLTTQFFVGGWYPTAPLQSLLLRHFGERYMTTRPFLKAFVVASREYDTTRAFLFRNYEGGSSLFGGSSEETFVQSAIATSSAPTDFQAVNAKGTLFVDGGIVANNPAKIALVEASSIWPDKGIRRLVSLGTGPPSDDDLPSVPTQQFITSLVKASTTSEGVHLDLEDFFASHAKAYAYYRFNPPIGGQKLCVSAADEIEKMVQIARKYVKEHPRFWSLVEFVKNDP